MPRKPAEYLGLPYRNQTAPSKRQMDALDLAEDFLLRMRGNKSLESCRASSDAIIRELELLNMKKEANEFSNEYRRLI